jgi:hypothetical protein
MEEHVVTFHLDCPKSNAVSLASVTRMWARQDDLKIRVLSVSVDGMDV